MDENILISRGALNIPIGAVFELDTCENLAALIDSMQSEQERAEDEVGVIT